LVFFLDIAFSLKFILLEGDRLTTGADGTRLGMPVPSRVTEFFTVQLIESSL